MAPDYKMINGLLNVPAPPAVRVGGKVYVKQVCVQCYEAQPQACEDDVEDSGRLPFLLLWW